MFLEPWSTRPPISLQREETAPCKPNTTTFKAPLSLSISHSFFSIYYKQYPEKKTTQCLFTSSIKIQERRCGLKSRTVHNTIFILVCIWGLGINKFFVISKMGILVILQYILVVQRSVGAIFSNSSKRREFQNVRTKEDLLSKPFQLFQLTILWVTSGGPS